MQNKLRNLIGPLALGAALAGVGLAQTTYTVDGVAGQGTGWDGSGIVAWDGGSQVTLTAATTFSAGDSLVVTAGNILNANLSGWDLSNLTLEGNLNNAFQNTLFTGATFGSTTITNASNARVFAGHSSGTGAAFSGNLSGLTLDLNGTFWRDGVNALNGSSFSGAVLDLSLESVFGFLGTPTSVSFAGATLHWGSTRTFRSTVVSNFSFSGATLNINAIEFWREAGGQVPTDWTNATINANAGGLFDSRNLPGIYTGQTLDFTGATLTGNIFAGLTSGELDDGDPLTPSGFTADFSGADVGAITNGGPQLANLVVKYNSATTVFGAFTEADAIAAGWVDTAATGPVDFRVTASGFVDPATFFMEYTYDGAGTVKPVESADLVAPFTDVSTRTAVSTPGAGRVEFSVPAGGSYFFRLQED